MNLLNTALPIFKRRFRKLRVLLQEKWLLLRAGLINKKSLSERRLSTLQPDNVVEYDECVVLDQSLFSKSTFHYREDKHSGTETGVNQSIVVGRQYSHYSIEDALLISNAVSRVSVFDKDGCYVKSCSTAKYRKKHIPSAAFMTQRYIPGVSLNLYGNVENSTGNYGHWLIDGISRKLLLKQLTDANAINPLYRAKTGA